MKRASWINLILGVWLIFSPFALGSMGMHVAVGNNVVLGILLIASSWWILAAATEAVGVSWFQMLCGIWLIISPFILQYQGLTHAMANDVVVGIIAFVVGLLESQALAHTRVTTS
jgi:SPW repeat